MIADLHGGDLDDIVAKAEFQEIKDRVMLEVRPNIEYSGLSMILLFNSAKAVKAVRMPTCGSVTSVAFSLRCRLKPLHNL